MEMPAPDVKIMAMKAKLVERLARRLITLRPMRWSSLKTFAKRVILINQQVIDELISDRMQFLCLKKRVVLMWQGFGKLFQFAVG